jgi:hypothetical protein
MAVPVAAFLTCLTIDHPGGETLGVRTSLKHQPIIRNAPALANAWRMLSRGSQ